jgi:hypothetical protein
MKIEIKPIIKTATSIDINISVHDINAMANCLITYNDSRFTEVRNVTIEGAEYDAWGTDDNYIYDLVLSKLGLERA